MKLYNKYITITAALAAMSCTDLTIYDEMGTQPDVAAMGTPVLSLRAEQAPDNVVSLTFTEGGDITSMTREVMIKSNVPMETNLLVDLTVDETALKAYEEENGLEAGTLKLLPVAFYRFSEGNSAEIVKGENTGKPNILTVYSVTPLGAELAPGRYLLPLKGESVGNELTDNSIMVDITVRQSYTDPDGYELYTRDAVFTVFYINTSAYDPRLANDMICELYDSSSQLYRNGIGHIVNLRTSSVNYDNITGQVSVVPSKDLRYVLDHYPERVRPVQESGRKVCVCIEGGGKGVGFCNFTDVQITEFVASVKRMVDTYGLDGINLWDRNSGYDKSVENGFPEMNTTSYPKLLKALDEAMPDKLITLVDYKEPTGYFHDVEAMGGLKPGDYIDYAWSGYCDESEPLQIVDPWTQFDDGRPEDDPYKVTKYKHRPIAGMSAENYGCIMATRYDAKFQPVRVGIPTIEKWVAGDNAQSNISVFYDLASITQGTYEGGEYSFPNYLLSLLLNTNVQIIRSRLENDGTGPSRQYNKWAKDW